MTTTEAEAIAKKMFGGTVTEEIQPREYTAEIRQQANLVAAQRLEILGNEAELDRRRQQWEAENAPLLEHVDTYKRQLSESEAALRQLALEAYEATGAKKPGQGVAIRVLTKVVYDPKDARRWCEEHNMFMAPEYKLFERFAKDNTNLVDCVSTLEQPQATIDTDLSKALK